MKIVEYSIIFLKDPFFLDIIELIHYSKKSKRFLKTVDKLKHDNMFDNLKLQCLDLFLELYSDVDNIHNLRGAYLELLVYEIIRTYHSPKVCVLNAYVSIDDVISSKTVDILALKNHIYLAAECKIKYTNFNKGDLINLSNLYVDSEHMVFPYLISLSESYHMERKIKILYKNGDYKFNFDVLNLISLDNFVECLCDGIFY